MVAPVRRVNPRRGLGGRSAILPRNARPHQRRCGCQRERNADGAPSSPVGGHKSLSQYRCLSYHGNTGAAVVGHRRLAPCAQRFSRGHVHSFGRSSTALGVLGVSREQEAGASALHHLERVIHRRDRPLTAAILPRGRSRHRRRAEGLAAGLPRGCGTRRQIRHPAHHGRGHNRLRPHR
jgi:hypothetical protein